MGVAVPWRAMERIQAKQRSVRAGGSGLVARSAAELDGPLVGFGAGGGAISSRCRRELCCSGASWWTASLKFDVARAVRAMGSKCSGLVSVPRRRPMAGLAAACGYACARGRRTLRWRAWMRGWSEE